MIAGCYTLHLYCDAMVSELCTSKAARDPARALEPREPAEFTADSGLECRKAALRSGWKLEVKAGRATCPSCARFVEVAALTSVQLDVLAAAAQGEDAWLVARAAARGNRDSRIRIASRTVMSLRRRGLLRPWDARDPATASRAGLVLTDEGRAALAAAGRLP